METESSSHSLKKPKGEQIDFDSEEEPVGKAMKLIDLNMSKNLLDSKFIVQFQEHWLSEKKLINDNIELFAYPFKLCVVQNFLKHANSIPQIVEEILCLEWSKKQMDLYEFHQSEDLANISSTYLTEFFNNLQNKVMPWIAQLCGVKLTYVSAACSLYNAGDYLLVHDDLLNDRQIAFVYYLCPFKGVETWKSDMGGHLEIFNTDDSGMPIFPTVNKVPPRNNQFIFFNVCSNSFHQVGEVTCFDYPRITINGWFHGENNASVVLHTALRRDFSSSRDNDLSLDNWINSTYLMQATKEKIQKHIEETSEVCLQNYLLPIMQEKILNELRNNKELFWTMKGPANSERYEILDINECDGLPKMFSYLFGSDAMFQLLHEYTDLDLSRLNTKDPKYTIEIQRWHQGFYTVLGDTFLHEGATLDLVLYLNESPNVGIITYVSQEVKIDVENKTDEEDTNDTEDKTDEEDATDKVYKVEGEDAVLLTIEPKQNSLNLIYRSKGTTMFTKYVSKKTIMSESYVYLVKCHYQE